MAYHKSHLDPELAVGHSNRSGVVSLVRINGIEPLESSSIDAVLLRVERTSIEVANSVVWLEGLSRSDWQRLVNPGTEFTVDGFSLAYTGSVLRNEVDSIPWPVQTVISVGNPKFLEGAGLLACSITGPGPFAGESGGPVLLLSASGSFCVGLIRRGGESSSSGLFLGEGFILPWLRALKVELRAVRASDLFPQTLDKYLLRLRERSRTLLVPNLGDFSSPATRRRLNLSRRWSGRSGSRRWNSSVILYDCTPEPMVKGREASLFRT